MAAINWIDENTAVSDDGSIYLIDDEGSIRHYPGRGWLKPRTRYAGRLLKTERQPFWHYRLKDTEYSRKILELMHE